MKINSKISFFAGIVTLIFITQIFIIIYLIMFDQRIARFLGFGALFIFVTILIYNLIMKYIVYLTKNDQDKKDNSTSTTNNETSKNIKLRKVDEISNSELKNEEVANEKLW